MKVNPDHPHSLDGDGAIDHGNRPTLHTGFINKAFYLSKPRRYRQEEILKKLNSLAGKHPFCILYKPKKNDPL